MTHQECIRYYEQGKTDLGTECIVGRQLLALGSSTGVIIGSVWGTGDMVGLDCQTCWVFLQQWLWLVVYPKWLVLNFRLSFTMKNLCWQCCEHILVFFSVIQSCPFQVVHLACPQLMNKIKPQTLSLLACDIMKIYSMFILHSLMAHLVWVLFQAWDCHQIKWRDLHG